MKRAYFSLHACLRAEEILTETRHVLEDFREIARLVRPGAKVLELFMDHYANACFRRLAACAGLHWGGLVGRTEPGGDPDWVHGTGWSVDLDRLAAVLDDPAFAPEDPH